MKEFYSRECNETLNQVKEELLQGNQVEWNTLYETFYGTGWSNWVEENLKDVACKIEVTGWNKWYDYPETLVLTPINK